MSHLTMNSQSNLSIALIIHFRWPQMRVLALHQLVWSALDPAANKTFQNGCSSGAIETSLMPPVSTFCSLCIWSLTKLLQIKLKSPFSYIYRTVSYLHAIYYRQNLNFSKLFCLEDEKKCQRPGKSFWGSPIQRDFRGFFTFSSFHALKGVGKVNIFF